MSAARDAIFGRVRTSLGRTGINAEDRAVLEARLTGRTRGPIPARTALDTHPLIDLFVDMAAAADSTIERVADGGAVPAALSDFLARYNLGSDIRMAPDPWLDTIPWAGRPTLTITRGASDGSDDVGVTAAFAAIAETGTLMLLSGPDSPTTLNFLPDNHIVVLRASQVMAAYEDGWDALRDSGAMPRTVNFITGPSRTGDIEQKILLGAHGPRRLHIILIEDAR